MFLLDAVGTVEMIQWTLFLTCDTTRSAAQLFFGLDHLRSITKWSEAKRWYS